VSRKITSLSDRRRLKEILEELDIPEGMGVIVRTAGAEREGRDQARLRIPAAVVNEIRDLTLKSTAPALIYEEGNLIKRSIRTSTPAISTRCWSKRGGLPYRQGVHAHADAEPRQAGPALSRPAGRAAPPFPGRSQIDAIHSPVGPAALGGYIVINQTERWLRSTSIPAVRHASATSRKRAAHQPRSADEIARQLRLRDLAGLSSSISSTWRSTATRSRSSAGSER